MNDRPHHEGALASPRRHARTPLIDLASPRWLAPTDAIRLWRSLTVSDRDAASFVAAPPGERTGSWTSIEILDDGVLRLTTDALRSHHLLFARHADRWIVTDDPSRLRTHLTDWARDDEAARTFLHTGFVPGTRTLADGVHATPAGSTVLLRPNGTWGHETWRSYHYSSEAVTDASEFTGLFERALDITVTRLLDRAGTRQLVLPLSGGLDSRLLAMWLLRHGASRITAFTYGRPGAPEVGVSARVAASLGIDWFSIDMDPDEVARRWGSHEAAAFRAAAHGLTSLPHVQDWYALDRVREGGLVDEDAVFLAGHTIVGNMHDIALARAPHDHETVIRTILDHHTRLRGHAPPRDLALIRDEVRAAETELSRHPAATEGREAQELVEWFNLRERQAKYINNSMRSYEVFGHDWALPMLDREMWECWLRGSPALTLTREWYSDFVMEHHANMTRTPVPVHTVGTRGTPSSARRAAIRVLEVTGGACALSRLRSMRTMTSHPMCFDAFNESVPRPVQIRSYLRGGSNLGLWTRLFLDGDASWACDDDSLPVHSPVEPPTSRR